MEKKAVIVSLKFHPGHVSHLIASYKQCEELGYSAYYYVDPKFIEFIPGVSDSRIYKYGKDMPAECQVSLFLFPSPRNLREMKRFRNQGTKVLYVFHEPVERYRRYLQVGYSFGYVIKKMLANLLYRKMVSISNAIILPSEKSLRMYDENKGYKNQCRYYVPLMFDDETVGTDLFAVKRKYFSYIGTIAIDHSYNECLDFMLWSIENDMLPSIKFLIATKNQVERTDRLMKAINSGRLVVIDGKPMKNEEINRYYAESYAIWNAYARTNQSGVLPKAFMCGSSAVILKENRSEFIENTKTVYALSNNSDKLGLVTAVEHIVSNFNIYSQNCRNTFLRKYYYRQYNQKLKEIIESC